MDIFRMHSGDKRFAQVTCIHNSQTPYTPGIVAHLASVVLLQTSLGTSYTQVPNSLGTWYCCTFNDSHPVESLCNRPLCPTMGDNPVQYGSVQKVQTSLFFKTQTIKV